MKLMDYIDSSYFSHTLLIVVAITFIVYNPGLPVAVSAQTIAFQNKIASLKPGDNVLIVYMIGASEYAVVGPAAEIVIRDIMIQSVNVAVLSTTPDGPQLMDRFIGLPDAFKIEEMKGKTYGKDYVNIGYLAGGEVMFVSFGNDVQGTAVKDFYGTPIDQLPMMQKMKTYKDINLVVFVIPSPPAGLVRVFSTTFNLPMIGVITGGEYPGALVYFPNQIKGLLNGLKGGGELETLLHKPGACLASTDPVTALLFMNVGLLILGNILFYVKRTKGVKKSG
jgi:hypothetical protein